MADDLSHGTGWPVLLHVAVPGLGELQMLVEQIATRIGCMLERRGLVKRDIENAWLAGQKPFTLQTVPARLQGLEGNIDGAATSEGFSLHAGIEIYECAPVLALAACEGSLRKRKPVEAGTGRPPAACLAAQLAGPWHASMGWVDTYGRLHELDLPAGMD